MSTTTEAAQHDPLASLNSAQRDAVVYSGGPLIVLAGPGTGKTRVIISRIVQMIRDGAEPGRVLALTFTNKAAGELRERLASALGPEVAEAVGAYTFNGFGAHILRRFADLAGLPPTTRLIDPAQKIRMMRTIVADRGLFADAVAGGLDSAIIEASAQINAMHCAALTPASARERVEARRDALPGLGLDDEDAEAARAEIRHLLDVVSLWEGFDRACLEAGLISFDDQLGRTNRLLEGNESARSIVRADCRWIVVDEFQDVNAAQIELLRQIAPPEASPDLCVVGDDDQAIYGFRGADDRAFEHFRRIWPGVETIPLEENYRSATPILSVANEIITRANRRFQEDKKIRRADVLGADPAGSAVEAVRLENEHQAGDVIAAMIRRVLSEDPELPLRRIAVIARTWKDLDTINEALRIEGIASRIARPPTPSRDQGVLDIVAWARLLLDPGCTPHAVRILRRPPNQLPVNTVLELRQRYLARQSRVEGTDNVLPFATWAAGEGAAGLPEEMNDPHTRAVLRRFGETWSALRELSATSPATDVIGEIVRRAGVIHAEMLDARARAARVSSVVGLMRFAAERADRLEEPGDLRAFMAYCDDLEEFDGKNRMYTPDMLTHEPVDAEFDDDTTDAVQLLTAHAAKGLEFDTVFVPRVAPPHGYPKSSTRNEEPVLPGWVAGEEDDDRGPGAARDDEERRLFYVACTRAERRLVLLGKVPKKSGSMNFLIELLGSDAPVVEREAGDLLGPFAPDPADRLLRPLDWKASMSRREAIRSARREARLLASGALDSADRADIDERGVLEAADRLGNAAMRLAAIARAESGVSLPSWLDRDPFRTIYNTIRAAGEEDAEPVSALRAVLRPLPPPLWLSFTGMKQWEQCPRCYYVNNVLRLPQPEGSPIVVGKITHSALQVFYERFRAAGERGEPEPGLEELLAIGDRMFAAAWADTDIVDPEQRRQIRALLRNCYEHMHDDRQNVVGVEEKYRFTYPYRGEHTITAKIDRIDVSGEGYRIIDYKTGQASKSLLEPKKDDLQLGVYMLALRASINEGDVNGENIPAGVAEYWCLTTGERGVIGFDDIDERKIRRKIEKTIDGMLDGDFKRGRGCTGACDLLEPGGSAE